MTERLSVLNPPIVRSFLSLNWRAGLRIILIFSVLLTLVLLVIYIFQVNAEVSERYLIQKYDNQLSETLRENQSLEINLMQSSSLNNVLVLMDELNFEKVDKVHHIRVLGNQVVAK